MAKQKVNIKRELKAYNERNPENKKNLADLAKAADTNYTTLSKYDEEAPMQVKITKKLADELGVTVDQLLKH